MKQKSLCMNLFLAAAVVLALSLPAGPSRAAWPEKPLTVVVPYAPGGDGDLSARLWAEFAEKKLGQPVLVVNKTGGGGLTGTSFAAAASPDGYTLFLVQAGPVLLTPHVAKTSYSFESFDYIARISVGNCALVVHAGQPWNTLAEFNAAATAAPNTYSFASPAATTWLSFAMRDYIQRAGIKVKHVEFQGTAPASTSVLGGHTTFTFCFPQNYASQVRAGQFKILAIGEKSADFPEALTFEEQGFPGSYYGWAGIAAPKGVPEDIRARISRITAEMVNDPEFIEKSRNIMATPSYLDEAAWRPILEAQHASLAELLAGLNLKQN